MASYILDHIEVNGASQGPGVSSIQVTMDGDKNVVAFYTLQEVRWSLTVKQATGGVISATPGTYVEGTVIPISAAASSGYSFDHWTINGLAAGNTNPGSITMLGAYELSGVFTLNPIYYTLTVTQPQHGSITPTGGSYLQGTSVQLTANPASGYKFDGWTGALSGTTNPQTIVMNSSKTVSGTFSIIYTNTPPVINDLFIWSYETNGVINPDGSVSGGNLVRIFATVTDAETPSSQLVVYITYKGQRIRALWEPLYNGYWYVEWNIPQAEQAGRITVLVEAYDPQLEPAITKTTAFNVTAYIPPDYAYDAPGQLGYVIWFSPRNNYYYVKYTPDGTIVSPNYSNLADAEAWRMNHIADVKVEDYATFTIWRTYDSSSYFVRDGSGMEVARYTTLIDCENWVRNTLPDEVVDEVAGYKIWATYHVQAASYNISPTSYYVTKGDVVKANNLPTVDAALKWIAENPITAIGIPVLIGGGVVAYLAYKAFSK